MKWLFFYLVFRVCGTGTVVSDSHKFPFSPLWVAPCGWRCFLASFWLVLPSSASFRWCCRSFFFCSKKTSKKQKMNSVQPKGMEHKHLYFFGKVTPRRVVVPPLPVGWRCLPPSALVGQCSFGRCYCVLSLRGGAIT